jgi:dipeptidase E
MILRGQMQDPTILAMGGGPLEPLVEHALTITGADRPRLLYVGTANAEDHERALWAFETFGRRAEVSILRFFPWPPPGLRDLVLGQDVVLVGGGNTANMLAIWRVHGFDEALREAWEKGVLLCGVSAGAICWFEAGVTDSFGPQLEGMRDGLGFLPGSACPHYDGEERRRPVYRRLVEEEGFPPGIAIDDGVGVLYTGRELTRVVTARSVATAYRVGPDGEIPLAAEAVQFQYEVRFRLPDGIEKSSGSFTTHRERQLGEIVNLPEGPDGLARGGKGFIWRIAAIEEDGTLVLDYERPHPEQSET